MNADIGREGVYAAELAAFGGTLADCEVGFDELLWIRNAICASLWWPAGDIDVERARSDARSSTTRAGDDGRARIRIAATQCTPLTLAHEVAHVLAGVDAGHGPRYRRAELDVVFAMFGSAEKQWLLDAFEAMDLEVADRSWPSPTEGPLQRLIDLA
ncbi:MAG: hypothetical protein ACO3M1_06385 [Ilumatobacteraceae bacterium]